MRFQVVSVGDNSCFYIGVNLSNGSFITEICYTVHLLYSCFIMKCIILTERHIKQIYTI